MFTKKLSSVKDNLHHAYLIEGEYAKVFPELLEYLQKNKFIETPGDIYQNSSETLNIDLSRSLKATQAEKAQYKFFILGANFFGHEAVNSLLKVFEEPTAGTHFFLITPNPHLLPATLKSRLQVLDNDIKKEINPVVLAEAKKFLTTSPTTRIKIIGEFLEEREESESTKSEALTLINAIESTLYKSVNIKDNLFAFEELSKVRDYLADRGASTKMLLEHLALALPTIK